MRLFLLRHAEAGTHADDAARELTELGWAQGQAVADWIAAQATGRVALVSSPLLRARQTASLVQQALRLPGSEVIEALAPEGDILQAEQRIALHLGDCEALVVVSHMPLLGSLGNWLTDGVLGMGESFDLAEVRVFEAEVIAPGLLTEVSRFRPEEASRALTELIELLSRF